MNIPGSISANVCVIINRQVPAGINIYISIPRINISVTVIKRIYRQRPESNIPCRVYNNVTIIRIYSGHPAHMTAVSQNILSGIYFNIAVFSAYSVAPDDYISGGINNCFAVGIYVILKSDRIRPYCFLSYVDRTTFRINCVNNKRAGSICSGS